MKHIRKPHNKTKEQLKELFITLIHENGLGSAVRWNDFQFEAKSYGTTIRGEILERELSVEIKGMFAKLANQKLTDGWNDLEARGLV